MRAGILSYFWPDRKKLFGERSERREDLHKLRYLVRQGACLGALRECGMHGYIRKVAACAFRIAKYGILALYI